MINKTNIVASVLVSIVGSTVALGQVTTLNVIARTGEAAPGGGEYVDFGVPVVGPDGVLMFSGEVEASGSFLQAIWLSQSSGTVQIARQGQAVPGSSGTYSVLLHQPMAMAISGDYAFRPGVANGPQGLWSSVLGQSLAPAFVVGDTCSYPINVVCVPPPPSNVQQYDSAPREIRISDGGLVAFGAEVADGCYGQVGTEVGIFQGHGSAASTRWVWGGLNTLGAVIGSPVVNDAGEVAVWSGAIITPTGAFPASQYIVVDRLGVPAPLFNTTDPAPGTFNEFSGFGTAPVINGDGLVAFLGILDGPSKFPASGVWSEGGGAGLELVALESDAAPGVAGAFFAFHPVFFNAFTQPLLAASGNTVFAAALGGTTVAPENDTGLWEGTSEPASLVAREGSLTPRYFIRAVTFGDFIAPSNSVFGVDPHAIGINRSDAVYFVVDSVDPQSGFAPRARRSVWRVGPTEIELIACTEGWARLSATETLQILDIDVQLSSGGEDGRPTGLFPTGGLAMKLLLSDGSEAIVTTTGRACKCPADLTGSAVPGNPAYGVPDCAATSDDFFYYLALFNDPLTPAQLVDLTGSAVSSNPAYGVPDGQVNNDDFFYFLDAYALGCS